MENMKFDKTGRPCWTVREVLRARPGTFFAWICLLGMLILYIAFVLTELFHLNRLFWAVPITEPIFLALCFALIIISAIQMSKADLNRKLKKLSPEEAILVHAEDIKAKWHPGYGTALGVIAWFITFFELARFIEDFDRLMPLVLLLIPVFIVLTKWFNRLMASGTNVNGELFDELEAGYHWDEIPQDCMNEKSLNKIFKRLRTGQARSLSEAISQYQFRRNTVNFILRVCLVGFLITAFDKTDTPAPWDSDYKVLEKIIRRANRK